MKISLNNFRLFLKEQCKEDNSIENGSETNGITMTIMMMGESTFTMKDWDDIIHELQQFFA